MSGRGERGRISGCGFTFNATKDLRGDRGSGHYESVGVGGEGKEGLHRCGGIGKRESGGRDGGGETVEG